MSEAPKVELLWWSGCPSWERALAMLREEMEAQGLDPEAVDVRRVETDEAAEREGFVGSPTIRIEGRDLQPPSDEPSGLTCRIYRLRDGRISPLPDRADLRDALAAATERSALQGEGVAGKVDSGPSAKHIEGGRQGEGGRLTETKGARR